MFFDFNFYKIKNLLSNRIINLFQLHRKLFFRLISSAKIKGRPILNQPLLTVGNGLIEFLGEVSVGYFPSPHYFSTYAHIEARNKNSKIIIGTGTRINNGFCAIAEHTSITIGQNCFIGTNVEIYDSDFHGLDLNTRTLSMPEWSRPVIIGDNVFICSNVKILKGATIGDCAVIGNGSIVVGKIPANTIAGGVPAKVLKKLI